MKKVVVNPGCISCGLCQEIAPELFEVTDISHVKEGIDFNKHEQTIQKIVASCPVQALSIKDETDCPEKCKCNKECKDEI